MHNLSSLDTAPKNIPAPSDFDSEHPIINMPFSVIIDGRLFEGDGISLVGARAQGLVSPQLEDELRLVTVVFPFAGFNITLPVEASLHTASSASGKLALRFTNPAGPHLPQLRHLLNSYISGDIADVGSVLSTSAGTPGGSSKSKPSSSRSFGRLLSGIAKGLLITAASVALFGFVGSKVYERVFVTHAQGVSLIGKSSTTLRAVNSGQLDFVDPSAAQGQTAYAIRTVAGDLVSVTMPCDCAALPGSLVAGATVLAGDTVMNVAPPDAPIEITTRVNLPAYRALVDGAAARVELANGEVISATLKTGTVSASASATEEAVQVVLLPQTEIDTSLTSTPVSVTIATANFAPVANFVRGLVSQGAK